VVFELSQAYGRTDTDLTHVRRNVKAHT